MTKDKALEIAIEWMEGLIQYLPSTKEHKATISRYNKAIIAIKEVLAQEQELVAYLCKQDENGLYGLPTPDRGCQDCFPVYQHLQRTWVGLTKDDIESWKLPDTPTVAEFAWFVEAKLKDKNCVG